MNELYVLTARILFGSLEIGVISFVCVLLLENTTEAYKMAKAGQFSVLFGRSVVSIGSALLIDFVSMMFCSSEVVHSLLRKYINWEYLFKEQSLRSIRREVMPLPTGWDACPLERDDLSYGTISSN